MLKTLKAIIITIICCAMVKSKKNEIRKLQTKLKLNITTIPTD